MSTATQQPEAEVQDNTEEQGNTEEQANAGSDTITELRDRLERWEESMRDLETKHNAVKEPTEEETDKYTRTKNMWGGRIKSIKEKIEQAEQNPEAAAEKKAAGTASKKKSGGLPICPCGCGDENKPGSRFRPGHDARVKGMISRVEKSLAVPGFQFPTQLIEYANTMPDVLKVANYDSPYILKMHKLLQEGGGVKQPKAEKEAEPAAAATE